MRASPSSHPALITKMYTKNHTCVCVCEPFCARQMEKESKRANLTPKRNKMKKRDEEIGNEVEEKTALHTLEHHQESL